MTRMTSPPLEATPRRGDAPSTDSIIVRASYNSMVERPGRERPAAHHGRWADQSESTTTMTTKGGIVGRGGGLVIWEARL